MMRNMLWKYSTVYYCFHDLCLSLIRDLVIHCLNMGKYVLKLYYCFFEHMCLCMCGQIVLGYVQTPSESTHPPTISIFFFFQVAPDTFLSSCDCPNIWVGETFKRDLERSTITLHLCLCWRGRNKSKSKKKAFSGGAQNIWSAGKHLKLPWLKSHFSSQAVTKWHLKTASLRITHLGFRIIQLKSLFY